MIRVTNTMVIGENEIQEEFIRSSGPGGQNVNKVATAVQLRFDVMKSPSLPNDVRERLTRLAGKRITEEGILIIEARQFRTQKQNRQDAMGRLIALIRKAAEVPKRRGKTRPTLASRKKRLETKRHRSGIKHTRRRASNSEV